MAGWCLILQLQACGILLNFFIAAVSPSQNMARLWKLVTGRGRNSGCREKDVFISAANCGGVAMENKLSFTLASPLGCVNLEKIPLNRPSAVGNEQQYIAEAMASGQLGGDGPFARRCQQLLEQRYSIPKVLLTHSCTGALEMAALLCEVGPGDEVIMPSYTFVSTANAFALRGAHPRFVDIRPDNLNIDEKLIEEAINEQTKVIVPVHYAGVGCEMDEIVKLADSYDLYVIEDAAQALDAEYRGRPLGTFGQLGCFSFDVAKNLVSGEGGALAVSGTEFADAAEIIHQKGTNRNQFLRGEVDKYTWVSIGSSYAASDITAAFLYGQLQQMDAVQAVRMKLWHTYHQALADLEEAGCLIRPHWPQYCSHNAHIYYLLTADLTERQALLEYLAPRGIGAAFHYVPLHSSPMGQRLGYRRGQLPVTEEMSQRLVRLPLYYELTEAEVLRVVDAVREFYQG